MRLRPKVGFSPDSRGSAKKEGGRVGAEKLLNRLGLGRALADK